VPQGWHLFGRDWETRTVRNLIVSRRLVLLHAPSGAGKTSLIQAGLMPLVKDSFLVRAIRVNDCPGGADVGRINRYVYSTATGLQPGAPNGTAPGRLEDYVLTSEGSKPELWIFDQFEEVLTLDPTDVETKREFFLQLAEVLGGGDRGEGVWALFAMRDDYLGPMEPYLKILPTGLSARFRLDLLDSDSAHQAIAGPFDQQQIKIEPEVVSQLVADLSFTRVQGPDGELKPGPGPYVEPVHLQLVSSRLYERRKNPDAPITDLRAIDNVNAALTAYYDETVDTIAGRNRRAERAIREWINDWLITSSGMRGQVMLERYRTKGLDNDVINQLVNAYLLRKELRRGITWYELAHDRLIEPIVADNKEWLSKNLSSFERRAVAWAADEAAGKSYLLKRHELWYFKHRERRSLGPLLPKEEQFVAASERAVKRQNTFRVLLALVAVAIVLAIGAAVFQQYLNGQNQARYLEADILAASALAQLNEDPEVSMLLALRAVERSPTPTSPQADYALRRSVAASHVRQVLIGHGLDNAAVPRESIGPAGRCAEFVSPEGCAVYGAAYDSTGSRVLTVGGDRTARIWDLIDGREIVFNGHTDRVTWGLFVNDNQVFTISDDGSARFWSATNGRELLALRAPPGTSRAIVGAAVSSDRDLVALSTARGEILIFRVDLAAAAADLVYTLHMGGPPVSWLELSPDLRQLVMAVPDERKVELWSLTSGTLVGELAHDAPVLVSTFSPDGKTIVTGSSDGVLRRWNAQEGTLIGQLTGHSSPISSVQFDPAGDLMLSIATRDEPVRIWDGAGAPVATIVGHAGRVFGASFSPDGRFVITAGEDHTARTWDSFTGRALSVLRGHSDWVYSALLSPDRSSIITASADGTSRIWDAGIDEAVLEEMPAATAPALSARSPDEQLEAIIEPPGNDVHVRAIGSRSELVIHEPRLRDPSMLAGVPFMPKHDQAGVQARRVGFDSSGALLVTTDSDGLARVWSTTTGDLIATLQGSSGKGVASAAFSRDGTRLIISTLDEAHVFGHEMFVPLEKVVGEARTRSRRPLDAAEILRYQQLPLPSGAIPIQRPPVSDSGPQI
jgi:WD40 repeat protein